MNLGPDTATWDDGEWISTISTSRPSSRSGARGTRTPICRSSPLSLPAGGLWMSGALVGKVGAAFTSIAGQHGGQETTLFSIITNLLHFSTTIVGLDHGFTPPTGVQEVSSGSPYDPTTIAGGDGSRGVHEEEAAAAAISVAVWPARPLG